MALVVNTNLNALNAQKNLNKAGSMLSKSMERLSSGFRINNASDDAAGLAISARLGTQLRGINQAIRNANDGVGMLQTAEGAMAEVSTIVTRIKELAVQSANGANSSADRTSLNDEVTALVAEVTRIATQTKFGSTALLDGSFSGTFQVGTDVGQTVTQSVANFKASSLTGNVASQTLSIVAEVTNVGAANAANFLGIDGATDLQVQGAKGSAFVRQTAAADDTASYVDGDASGLALAKVVNESTSTTGVSATVQETSWTGTDAAQYANAINIDGSTNKVTVNGVSVIINVNGGSVSTRRQQFIDAVNAQVAGVVASTSGTAGVTLKAADGRNISASATSTGANTAGGEIFGFTTAVTTEKVLARADVKLQASGNITTVDGTNAGAASGQLTGEGTATAAATALSSLSVTSVSNANTAMIVSDAILDTISSERGKLGAVQNRLASTVANLGVVAEKVADSRSRILDADFAAETAALTKAQILQQAAISILSQANAAPQAALQLLRQ